MTIYQDGANADKNAIDFKQSKSMIDNTFNEEIHMAAGGGLAVMLEHVK